MTETSMFSKPSMISSLSLEDFRGPRFGSPVRATFDPPRTSACSFRLAIIFSQKPSRPQRCKTALHLCIAHVHHCKKASKFLDSGSSCYPPNPGLFPSRGERWRTVFAPNTFLPLPGSPWSWPGPRDTGHQRSKRLTTSDPICGSDQKEVVFSAFSQFRKKTSLDLQEAAWNSWDIHIISSRHLKTFDHSNAKSFKTEMLKMSTKIKAPRWRSLDLALKLSHPVMQQYHTIPIAYCTNHIFHRCFFGRILWPHSRSSLVILAMPEIPWV